MDTIKVLVVDDEHLERALIMLGTHWTENGFEIVGEADSGQTALEKIEEEKPDIVFTDICMPFMDGLELTEKIRERYPHIKIVIITGHREFEYAQRALRYGVTEFLLKPIKIEEIAKIANNLKSEILREREAVEEYVTLKEQVNQSRNILKENFLKQLLTGKLKKYEIENKLKDFKLEYFNDEIQCFSIEISEDVRKGSNKMDSIVREVVKDISCSEYVYLSETKVVFILGNITSTSPMNRFYESLLEKFIEKFSCNVSIGVGGIYSSYEGILLSFEEAEKAMKARVIYGWNQVIHYRYVNTQVSSVPNIFDVDWKELSFHAKNGIEDKVTAFIDSYISKLSELGNIELSTLRMLCANIISVLNTVLNEMGKKISDIFKSDSDIYKQLGEIETLKDAAEVLKEYGVQITQYINEVKGKKVNDLAQKAKEYIDCNYTKADLNLTDIASNLYVNQSYLSRVFKVETKESIVDYISKLRINKSIEYIANTNLKAYEIAEKVGINDPHYFSICFKKYTGKSVNEFKKTVGRRSC